MSKLVAIAMSVSIRIIVVLKWVGTVSVLFIMLMTVADFTSRNLLNNPIKGVVEISTYLLVGIIFLGFGFAQMKDAHVKVDAITQLLSPAFRSGIKIVTLSLTLAIFSLIAWQGGAVAWESALEGEYRWGLVPIPLWPARLTVPIGCGALCLQLVIDTGREVAYFIGLTRRVDKARQTMR